MYPPLAVGAVALGEDLVDLLEDARAAQLLGLALVGPLAASIGVSTMLLVGAAAITLCQAMVILVPGVRKLEYRPEATGPAPNFSPVEAGD